MIQYITHPDATFSGIPTCALEVRAKLFDGTMATDQDSIFNVLMPAHLQHSSAIERLINRVTEKRFMVMEIRNPSNVPASF